MHLNAKKRIKIILINLESGEIINEIINFQQKTLKRPKTWLSLVFKVKNNLLIIDTLLCNQYKIFEGKLHHQLWALQNYLL